MNDQVRLMLTSSRSEESTVSESTIVVSRLASDRVGFPSAFTSHRSLTCFRWMFETKMGKLSRDKFSSFSFSLTLSERLAFAQARRCLAEIPWLTMCKNCVDWASSVRRTLFECHAMLWFICWQNASASDQLNSFIGSVDVFQDTPFFGVEFTATDSANSSNQVTITVAR